MTNEEKELIIKDICGRLPNGLFVDENVNGIYKDPVIYTRDYHPHIDNCKPYLRSISSMTEEEKVEYRQKQTNYEFGYFDNYASIDWLNKKGFDYRGLIEKGLALEAKEGMYIINLKQIKQ